LLNKTLNLAVLLHRAAVREHVFAVVQVPSVLPRFVPLPAEKGHVLISLENVIRLHLEDLFPGMAVKHDTVFRVTRNSDFEIDDDDVEDLLKTIEEEVRKRRRGTAVRLQIRQAAPPEIERFLMNSLDHVVDFIEAAADDDRVLAIKQTLYRTSSDSPIVKALARAADKGKQVCAVIELKARLDEERNILWSKELEKFGVHVVYGFVGLKIHA